MNSFNKSFSIRLIFIAICIFSFTGRSEPNPLYRALSSFQSERLKYEFLKPEHYAGLEAMFEQIDLYKLMGKQGFTAPLLVGAFKTFGEKVAQLSDSLSLGEPVTLVYGITRLDNGEFIGSATIQTLTPESIAAKNSAFAERAQRHGQLFAVGYAFMEAAQGKGFGKETCEAIVKHFFAASGNAPMALIASSFKGNVASAKLSEGCGFEKFLEEESTTGDPYHKQVHHIRVK